MAIEKERIDTKIEDELASSSKRSIGNPKAKVKSMQLTKG